MLLDGSGRVVNSLDCYPVSLLKVLWLFLLSVRTFFKMEFTVPTSKAFLQAQCQSVSGNKQELVACAVFCWGFYSPFCLKFFVIITLKDKSKVRGDF